MVLNNGDVLSRDDVLFTFSDDPRANARYNGFKDGKHHVNLDIETYEITKGNIRALMIHEIYGHGIMDYDSPKLHHKSYFSVIDSRYWEGSTTTFKAYNVNRMWEYYYKEVGYGSMPSKYQNAYWKYYDK